MEREDLAYIIAIYNLFWYTSISVYGMEKEYQSDFRRLWLAAAFSEQYCFSNVDATDREFHSKPLVVL